MSAPRIGSLCSGYEGLGMAVQAVIPDAELAWVSDIDKGARKVLAHRYPNVPNLGDTTAVDWASVEPVDILTGGTPCQDLSHAGKRAGMTAGTRSNLWVAMREAIAVLRPSLVIWENVRGAGSAEADSDLESNTRLLAGVRRRPGQPVLRALGRVVGDLAELGYVGRVRGLRAADIGACHGRFRYFLAAHPAGHRWWPEPAGVVGRPHVAQCGDGAVALLPTPMAQEPGGTPEQYRARWVKSDGRNSTFLPLSMAVQLLPTPAIADVTGGRKSRSGARSDELLLNGIAAANQWGDYADAIARWEAITRPAPAPTQPSKKGTPQLSARFSEWLMGLPDGWITDVPGITRNEALKLAGNGVVWQQAAAALRIMLARAEDVAA